MKKIGMRTIKTGIGVFICAFFGPFIVQNPNSSAVACLLSMQDTVSGSLEAGLGRIQGTIFGGIIGFIILSMFPGNPWLCGLGVIFTIYACNLLKLNQGVSIACITFLSIQMGFTDSTPVIVYSFNRILDTCVGVIVALVINFTLARPNYLHILYSKFELLEEKIHDFLQYKVIEEKEFTIEELTEVMNEIESTYTKLIGELGYHKENINIDRVEKIMNICREVNFHIQSIELLEKKLYLNKHSHEKLLKMYHEDDIVFDLDEEQSPVFNYHLAKVIEILKALQKENVYYKQKNNKKKFLNVFKKKND